MDREMDAGRSRCRATGCFTCASPKRPATARSSHVIKLLWDERTGPLYQQLEHHYDSPDLWRRAMSEHRAVLKSIAARDADAARSRCSGT